jgi:hypothetical protein
MQRLLSVLLRPKQRLSATLRSSTSDERFRLGAAFRVLPTFRVRRLGKVM